MYCGNLFKKNIERNVRNITFQYIYGSVQKFLAIFLDEWTDKWMQTRILALPSVRSPLCFRLSEWVMRKLHCGFIKKKFINFHDLPVTERLYLNMTSSISFQILILFCFIFVGSEPKRASFQQVWPFMSKSNVNNVWNLTWKLLLQEKCSFKSLLISLPDIWIYEFGQVIIKLQYTYPVAWRSCTTFSQCSPWSISNKEINMHYLFNEKTSTELGTHSNVEAKDEAVEFTVSIVCFFGTTSRISISLQRCQFLVLRNCHFAELFLRIVSLKIHK